ncbi:hypothetical protein [Brevibacillus dissolubilis]|uniref:hypothetical protein n=1 Tax=Brevibacillus dissolubilis TaxID=1844116 RepID=UPI0011171DA4|nr:hypothetical protein [Brevibacillus dissolubilis]
MTGVVQYWHPIPDRISNTIVVAVPVISMMKMKPKVLLIYGDALPPFQHIQKIINTYNKYFLNDRENGVSADQYYEIWITVRHTGRSGRKQLDYTPTVPVKIAFLPRFLAIFEALKGTVHLCQTKHEHPTIELSGMEYEGYCYYLDNEKEKIIFYENLWTKVDVQEDSEEALARLITSCHE